jgi:hypothetical protein
MWRKKSCGTNLGCFIETVQKFDESLLVNIGALPENRSVGAHKSSTLVPRSALRKDDGTGEWIDGPRRHGATMVQQERVNDVLDWLGRRIIGVPCLIWRWSVELGGGVIQCPLGFVSVEPFLVVIAIIVVVVASGHGRGRSSSRLGLL